MEKRGDGNGIATCEDFRRVIHHSNVESVTLPASGLTVKLCRPPVFAALVMGRKGLELQAKATDGEIKSEDSIAFTDWIVETLGELFVDPPFGSGAKPGEIGLRDILMDDLKFIFRWLRGEIGPGENHRSEDLGAFRGGQATTPVPGGSGEAQSVSSE